MTAASILKPLAAVCALALVTACGQTGFTAPGLGRTGAAGASAAQRPSYPAYASLPQAGAVSVLDLGTARRAGSLNVGKAPSAVALSPEGDLLAVANEGANTVSIFEASGKSLQATVKVGKAPSALVFSPSGRTLFVACERDNRLDFVSVGSGKLTKSFTTGDDPVSIAIDGPAGRVFTANAGDRTVTAIDYNEELPLATFKLPGTPSALVAAGQNRLFVALPGSHVVAALDTASGQIVGQIQTGKSLFGGSKPTGLALSPDRRALWIANAGRDFLSVADTVSLSVDSEIALNSPATRVALSPDGRYALAAHPEGYATLINVRTSSALSGTIELGRAASGLAIGPAL